MYKKGESGNPGGKSKTQGEWRDAIRMALYETDKVDRIKKIRKLARVLVQKAEQGDVAALKEIGDRIDGKPAQSIEASGPNGGAIVINVLPTDELL